MELKRRRRNWTCLVLLLITVNVAAASQRSENKTGLNLDCTNDFDGHMFCDFEAQNCSEYNLTLLSNEEYGEKHCLPKLCESGRCCCSVEMIFLAGESHNATVWKKGQSLESRIISITKSIKPKTPTIIAVDEVNRSFRVKWKTNTERILGDDLTANVTYYKKGDTAKVSLSVTPTNVNGLSIYDISGQTLEPSTTYVVSVRSYTSLSGKFSDSSNEFEFTTSVSRHSLYLAVIIGLSFATVIITGAAYTCYNKSKAKWWDTVTKSPNPKLFDMCPGEQKILKPVQTSLSSVSIDPAVLNNSEPKSGVSLTDTSSENPQQSSGISAGSSSLRSANTKPAVDIKACVQDAIGKAFAQLRPRITMTTSLLRESNKEIESNKDSADTSNTSPGSTDFDNMSYFDNIPSCPNQIMMDSSEVQTQAGIVCDSAYHASEGVTVTCPDQQVPACPLLNLPPVVSSLMPTDMSYQQCNADSGRFLNSEESSLSSISNGTSTFASCDPVSMVESGRESFSEVVSGPTELNGKTEEATVCDDNPCYGWMPAGSHSFPPVDDNYQSFQNLVEQPEFLFLEPRSGEKKEHLSK